jgi:hypothetical protein
VDRIMFLLIKFSGSWSVGLRWYRMSTGYFLSTSNSSLVRLNMLIGLCGFALVVHR